ncbi:hypothetical protein [Coleofasciculus sp. E1-EBD-02]|jgi:hypothetical protein|uniref:hypothetical protein n=1 Tax=unclassified Coleofasciculus TaxID=2692782 RepID=UPI0032F7A362
MKYKSLIMTALYAIIGIAMIVGTLILPISAASADQIPELHFEREEFASQEMSNAARIECSNLSKFESAIQLAQNQSSKNDPGTCIGAYDPRRKQCTFAGGQCNPGYIPTLGSAPECQCTCLPAS